MKILSLKWTICPEVGQESSIEFAKGLNDQRNIHLTKSVIKKENDWIPWIHLSKYYQVSVNTGG